MHVLICGIRMIYQGRHVHVLICGICMYVRVGMCMYSYVE